MTEAIKISSDVSTEALQTMFMGSPEVGQMISMKCHLKDLSHVSDTLPSAQLSVSDMTTHPGSLLVQASVLSQQSQREMIRWEALCYSKST